MSTVNLREDSNKSEEGGYLNSLSKDVPETDVKFQFQIAEAIIVARVADLKARAHAAENKQQREKLLAIIASKEAQELEERDIESLKEMAESLR